uniref:Uncharacterized protein n=1 Tax=Oryza brachyantha TaxID=4533 RepID=J3NDA6_ORYBR
MSEGYIQKGLREIPSKETLGNMQEGTEGLGFAGREIGIKSKGLSSAALALASSCRIM